MKMKKQILPLMLLVPVLNCFAQIDANLLLGLTSGTTAEINAIAGPLEGSILYNTTEKRMYLYNASIWEKIPDITDLLPPTFTDGSILFASSSGAPDEDNGQLFWDSTNNRLGVGTNTPDNKMQVTGAIRSAGLLNSNGNAGEPAYRFTDDTDTGMYSKNDNELSFTLGSHEALRLDRYTTTQTQVLISERLGIGFDLPENLAYTGVDAHSTLEVKGSVATAIDVTTGDLTLDDTHHTIILGGAHNITLPDASTCKGRIYVIKNPNTLILTATISTYKSLIGVNISAIASLKTIWVQSDGTNWQQIQ
ncbi:hypothetical protein M4I21_14855 [Cellulophaga sp. 20_2_10]|uniref:hypothetical protein n=1 Tax=Cellulophaga sp. 20_2_10 TaxID=2942476 RepID=UPI00201A28A5|nr:hypothetical protein [Cellulophaga sp. 20_2_10]MCL5247099.1 hypothetical protein [Cellulophaga sp. 20_2_10]